MVNRFACSTLIILSLFFITSIFAAETDKKNIEPSKIEKDVANKTKPKTALQKTKKSKPLNWPQPFVPTEKIGADSVISFPADI